jgi:ribosomal protein S18 acetylase RimI-like enzyme
MLNELLERMRSGEIRKVFVSTSDYQNEEDGKVYAAAQRMYENAGFIKELEHPNYYSPGETQLIYGLALIDIQTDVNIAPDDTCVYFNGLTEIEETDDVYVINWDAQKKKLFGKSSQFTQKDLDIGIKQAEEWHARSIFVSFPSNMPSVLGPLEAAGFFEEGRLKDYYQDGLDEIHFRFNF